ncbi:sporulation initiation inhibitor Soj [candidate division WOR-1 bacterium RIFOXYD2_FULL_36_8]|uniref:Sporulation initiation inhibitor Soj n=1 Tax=candidate division WOR-1 bacterium RIFOXYB2_FULL_37_13 TaxID=1802579 RepID=A0A1F4SVE5_UNCSA|nr:MAG: sporulation initiation inhibitor Soj [candidate division WOR-1 bacterium RIFOXYA2_FULL_37_7]OGC24414.1 MAG: sporulation initiation inhibitor Soj [candidate division WOR-1 bacterium RIFOXYB2_FULL_37_13]OGC37490.1 MAG: sporulation initiation inhibitor Soj [candidate division WOR-1 bacterium RIFOXYC2_FULL_37_10]OGC37904.1 MAG: sporulation initiation inhibitor Soj [candidate division WOR-1 bacterium RIFOXYD2_FULL_36_8]
MGVITAFVNQKGGVGKTTTTVNLAAYLASLDKKVLVLDMDPQGNATVGCGVDRQNLETCIYNVMVDQVPIIDVIQKTAINNLDIIPATARLAGAEVELVSAPEREFRLKKALFDAKQVYDYLMIDCPPSLNLLTVNALTAADEVVIPIQCEYYALEGISQLIKTLDLVRERLNPMLKIGGVLLTMHDQRTVLANQVVEEARKHFGSKVFQTIIPRNVRLAEAPSFGQPIIFYDPGSKGALAYEQLSREVVGNE